MAVNPGTDGTFSGFRRGKTGKRSVCPRFPPPVFRGFQNADLLTDRERQVLRYAGEGDSSAEIAGRLSLSEGTVRNYLSEAISKLGASNRTEAARIARQKGWV